MKVDREQRLCEHGYWAGVGLNIKLKDIITVFTVSTEEWSQTGQPQDEVLTCEGRHLKNLFAVSLWHKGDHNRSFPFMEATL